MSSGVITITTMTCPVDGTVYGLSETFREARALDGRSWHCPLGGHTLHYPGETDAQKIERLQKSLRDERDAKWAEARRADTANIKFRNLKRRVLSGVCPHCSRTFKELQRHVQSKHPAEAQDAGVKPLSPKRTARK